MILEGNFEFIMLETMSHMGISNQKMNLISEKIKNEQKIDKHLLSIIGSQL